MNRRRLVASLRRRARWEMDAVRQFQVSILALLLLALGGTAGYVLLEGMTWVEAAYMTSITLTTVGFGEVRPLSPEGRLFTMALILLGVSLSAYAVRQAAEVAFGESLWISLGERDVNRQLHTIRDHFIVCGYGRMGREIANEFARRQEPYVIVDRDERWHPLLVEAHIPHVIGDATRDEVLVAAGIERARGLLAVVDNDADNVLIVLSAKGLNQQVKVVARSSTDEIESKLLRAGADSVTSPYIIGGQRMAFAMVRPAVYDFLNNVVYSEETHSEMGEMAIGEGSPLVGRTLRESGLRHEWEAIVLAIVGRDASVTISPSPNHRLAAGDTLIVVAPSEKLRRLEADHHR